ncbi:MAG: ferritin-like domain-containing protein [Candidatus Contendobacter sp.]|nr:ferritin-like domain-containing protein [Candidatus Contendobacter sp.]
MNMTQPLDNQAAIGVLNRILELELAGVVRYTHYALMVYGYSRIPIVSWLNAQADESLLHARQAGELITSLGGHPSLGIGPLLETHQHDIGDILRESLAHEGEALKAYYALLDCAKDRDVRLEEYARTQIAQEQTHVDEVNKMLRAPGQTQAYVAGET